MIEAGDIRWALNPCGFLHQKQLADTYSPQTLDARTSSLHYLFRQYLYAEPQRRLDEAGYLSSAQQKLSLDFPSTRIQIRDHPHALTECDLTERLKVASILSQPPLTSATCQDGCHPRSSGSPQSPKCRTEPAGQPADLPLHTAQRLPNSCRSSRHPKCSP